jgi:hypothetical protein
MIAQYVLLAIVSFCTTNSYKPDVSKEIAEVQTLKCTDKMVKETILELVTYLEENE